MGWWVHMLGAVITSIILQICLTQNLWVLQGWFERQHGTVESAERSEFKWLCHSPAVRALATPHISYTTGRVLSSWPDSKGHDEDQTKSCEKTLPITVEHLGLIFYHFLIRFIFKMPGSPVWPIKHYESDFWVINLFQRLMELSEDVPECWLLEISSDTFLPMRFTASFPMMLWARGFLLLLSLQAANPSIRLAGPPKGHFLSSVSQNG